jgi:predicted HTH domain antitoxin
MPTTVEIKGEFEIKIKRLIDAGLYGNTAEAVRDALRHMLREYDEKEIAVGLYRQGKVSLAKAAGIAGVSMTRMKEILIEKGIKPRIGVEGVKELYEDYETLKGTSD